MNSAHFSFKLRKDRPKKDGSVSIYLYANVNSKISWYSTKISVKPKHWNEKKQEVFGDAPNKFELNNQLETYISKAKRYIQQCDFNDEVARNDKLDTILRSNLLSTNSYYEFVEAYITDYKSKYKYKTLQGFKTHLFKLKSFKPNLDINEIDVPFWHKYEAHLMEIGNKANTIHKQSRLLKKFINKAIEHDVVHDNPLNNIKVKREDGKREYLTIEEVKNLQQIFDQGEISNKGQQNVLRYFLFACYTSIRYQDVKELKHKHIINNALNINFQKTGKPISIPLSEKASVLIVTKPIPNNNVFKVFTNQVTNRHLKQIMKLAGIKKEISFHCARNTWAMITLELTYNIALVSDILGHSDIRITQIYAKIQEKAKTEAMRKWDEF